MPKIFLAKKTFSPHKSHFLRKSCQKARHFKASEHVSGQILTIYSMLVEQNTNFSIFTGGKKMKSSGKSFQGWKKSQIKKNLKSKTVQNSCYISPCSCINILYIYIYTHILYKQLRILIFFFKSGVVRKYFLRFNHH